MGAIWNYAEEENNAIKNIEYVKSLYDAQVQKVAKEQYIQTLIFEDYVSTVKQNTSRYDYMSADFFRNAQKDLKEKVRKKSTSLGTLKTFMMDDFLNNDKNFKLVDIMACGYEDYAWSIYFDGYKKTICISIPMMKNISTKNIQYAHNGKFAFLIKESESYWRTIKQSYKIEDIANAIKDYFHEEEWEDSKEM